MSTLVIPSDVALTVTSYYKGQGDIATIISQIGQTQNPQETLGILMQEIVNVSEGKPSALGINLDQRIIELYENLTSVHESRLEATQSLAQTHLFSQAKPLQVLKSLPCTGELVSHLLEKSTVALDAKNFEPIQRISVSDEPLVVTLRTYNPLIANSLCALQQVLGNIHTLRIEYESFSEEELIAIITACSRLKCITLNYSNNFTDGVIEKACWHEGLEAISIQQTPVTKIALEVLCQKCPGLLVLNVCGCSNISHIELMTIEFPKTLIDFSCDPYDDIDNLKELYNLVEANQHSPVALTIAARAWISSPEQHKQQALQWLEKAMQRPNFLAAEITHAELVRTGALDIPAFPTDTHVNRLLKLFPRHPGLLACTARFLIAAGFSDEAYTNAELAYLSSPADDFVLATYAANSHLTSFFCKNALRRNPENTYALSLLAEVTENNVEAEELYRKALHINYHDQDALIGLALLLLESNNAEKNIAARGYLQEAVKAHPYSAGAYIELAKLFLGNINGIAKDEAEYTRLIEIALFLKPNHSFFSAAREETAAEPNFKKSKNIDADEIEADDEMQEMESNSSEDLGLVAIDVDAIAVDEEEPKSDLEKLERCFDSKNPELLTALGELLLPYDSDRAVMYLDRVADEHFNESLAANLALAKFRAAHHYELAKDHLSNALKLAPKDVHVHVECAKLELSYGKMEDAKKFCISALQLAPTYPPALVLKAKLQLLGVMKDNPKTTLEIILNTPLAVEMRTEILAILCEFPDFMSEQRSEVLKNLTKN